MKVKFLRLAIVFICLFSFGARAQTNAYGNPSLIHYFNKDKTRFIQFSGYMELWARYSQLNPGSMVNGDVVKEVSDLSIRRLRAKVTYKPTEKLMMVLQMGPSNVNVNAKSSTYMDLLDAYAEYKFSDKFAIGGGRSTWRGLSRFSTGPLATLTYDIPLYAYTNAGITDVTVRSLNIYAKGQLGRFDYRVAVADPYTDVNASAKKNVSVFNTEAANKEFSGYFKYQFMDKEANTTPFEAGTYLGKKRVFNIGAGFEYMNNALWHLDNEGNTHNDDMKNEAADVFYDAPLNKSIGTSISVYGIAMHSDYGPNYVRMSAINNPASGLDASMASLNGSGNALPVGGTGNTYYLQLGGTLPYFNQRQKGLQLMPAVSAQYSKFKGLTDAAITYDAGVTLLFNGHASKLTFDAQSRPIFELNTHAESLVTDRKMTFLLKYRIDII